MVLILDPTTLSRTWAVTLIAFGIFALVRSLIHVVDYACLRPAKTVATAGARTVRRQLNGLVAAMLVLVLAWLAGAVALFMYPQAPLTCKVLPPLALCAAFYALVLATLDRASEAHRERGTEIVRESPFGKWLFKLGRSGDSFPPVRWLMDWLDDPTPEDRPSVMALSIAMVLLVFPVAELEAEMTRGLRDELERTFLSAPSGDGQAGKPSPSDSPRQERPPPPEEQIGLGGVASGDGTVTLRLRLGGQPLSIELAGGDPTATVLVSFTLIPRRRLP